MTEVARACSVESGGSAQPSRERARPGIRVKRLGLVEYEPTWRAMQQSSAAREADSDDEIWLLQHAPVYTLGLAGRREHLLRATDTPVVKVDRGGQITYHGPGQLIAYLLLDLKRRGIGVKELVRRIEQAIIDLLASYGIQAQRRPGAPGVYVEGAKIAALGLRVRDACCYHGLALNCDMDLAPFAAIDPCGYPGLAVTQLSAFGVRDSIEAVGDKLLRELAEQLGSRPSEAYTPGCTTPETICQLVEHSYTPP